MFLVQQLVLHRDNTTPSCALPAEKHVVFGDRSNGFSAQQRDKDVASRSGRWGAGGSQSQHGSLHTIAEEQGCKTRASSLAHDHKGRIT